MLSRMNTPGESLRKAVAALDPKSPRHVVDLVEAILSRARDAGASDVHLQPEPGGMSARWRIDGVLHPAATLPAALAPNVVARLKVLADLLTYRSDIPQEGRIRGEPGAPEMRVSTFPTLHGEKAVVRIFGAGRPLLALDDLGLGDSIAASLRRGLAATSGMIVVSGPAGSGKTTTVYASLRELAEVSGGRRSLATLEDPIEAALDGVAQSQVNPAAGFTLESGLRSLMRQDPEVIAVGEIRDRATAEVAFQAALTGHLVLTTFHAGGAAAALGRLADLGIEPYLLRSALIAVASQRLVRRLCGACARLSEDPADFLGLDVPRARLPVGCAACGGSGYSGRRVLAEWLDPDRPEVARGILGREDVTALERGAVASGMLPLREAATGAVAEGWTSPAEVRRVLGVGWP